MLVISGMFLFTSRDIGYLGNLIKGIFPNLLKGIWDTFLYTYRDIGNPPFSIQASSISQHSASGSLLRCIIIISREQKLLQM